MNAEQAEAEHITKIAQECWTHVVTCKGCATQVVYDIDDAEVEPELKVELCEKARLILKKIHSEHP